jgi:hypothetical protein
MCCSAARDHSTKSEIVGFHIRRNTTANCRMTAFRRQDRSPHGRVMAQSETVDCNQPADGRFVTRCGLWRQSAIGRQKATDVPPRRAVALELPCDVPYSRRVRSNDRYVPRKISLILIAPVNRAWSKLFEPEVPGKVIRERGTSNGPHCGRLLFPSSNRHRYGDARFLARRKLLGG